MLTISAGAPVRSMPAISANSALKRVAIAPLSSRHARPVASRPSSQTSTTGLLACAPPLAAGSARNGNLTRAPHRRPTLIRRDAEHRIRPLTVLVQPRDDLGGRFGRDQHVR